MLWIVSYSSLEEVDWSLENLAVRGLIKAKQRSMKAHLVKCFETNKLIPFPCINKINDE